MSAVTRSPRDDVKARGGGQRQHGGDAEQREESGVDVADAGGAGGGAEAEVDHLLESVRNRQGGAGCHHQRDAGHDELAAVRKQERQQALECGQAAFAVGIGLGGAGRAVRHCVSASDVRFVFKESSA
jgi:hypothetical protein